MNMNYIKYNFDANSMDLVISFIENKLINKLNVLLSNYNNLRVQIYKNMDLFYYTLILCDISSTNDGCLGFKGFTNFIQSELREIGFKIPLFWKRKMDDKLLWQRKSANDIYCDVDILNCHEKKRS